MKKYRVKETFTVMDGPLRGKIFKRGDRHGENYGFPDRFVMVSEPAKPKKMKKTEVDDVK